MAREEMGILEVDRVEGEIEVDDFEAGGMEEVERRTGMRVVRAGLRRAKKMEMGARERERLVHLAGLLPGAKRLIMQAYLEHGMTVKELAELHRTTAREMRRRVDRLRESLADPSFVLAAQGGGKLPGELRELARAYWVEGRGLRELARARGESLHKVRQEVAMARVLLAAGGR